MITPSNESSSIYLTEDDNENSVTNQEFVTNEIDTTTIAEKDVNRIPKVLSKISYTDRFCDPDNPVVVTFHDVTIAQNNLREGIVTTPCKYSHMSSVINMDLYMKMEILQHTGSFKDRGARNALMNLTMEQKSLGVITASLGNHAQSLSYNGRDLKIPVTVVIPTAAPLMKIQNCRNYGARVIVNGKDMSDAKALAMEIANKEGLIYLNGYDHPHVIAGQGTIGLEILEQVADPDAIIVPVGGGGLIAGIATVVKTLSPNTKIIGVESEKCPGFYNAIKNSYPIHTPIENTLADGLAVPVVGYNAFITAAPLIDKMIQVKEEWIALAILRLVEQEKCVVEGAGAAGLAAVLAGQLDELKGKKVVILLCGGNIDTTLFGRCLERGLAAEGRLVKFVVRVADGPGGLADLTKLLSDLGISIKHITQERAWLKDAFSVEVTIICETRDWNHSLQMKKQLNKNYKCVYFIEEPLAIPKNCFQSSIV